MKSKQEYIDELNEVLEIEDNEIEDVSDNTIVEKSAKTITKNLFVKLNNGWTLNTDDISNTVNLVNVYPNPNHGEFTILYRSGEESDITINVLTISGQLIKSQVYPASISELRIPVYMKNQPKGFYFIQVIQGNHRESHKVLLQ